MQNFSSYSPTSVENECSYSSILTISFLNVRSLRKHSNIKFHSRLFSSDVIAFTETQLLPHDSDNEITESLRPFKIHHQDHNNDKYSSMVVCTRNTVEIKDCEFPPSINALKCVLVDTKLQEPRSLLLLYRKHNSNTAQYVDIFICTSTPS